MNNLEHYLNEQMLNELSLETYQKAIEKADKERFGVERANITKLAKELIKRNMTSEYKDKSGVINKIELLNGDIEYRNNKGELHREDGPALERNNGDNLWFLNGKPNRKDGPAVELNNGYKSWQVDGKYHREDGPAIVDSFGNKEWYVKGVRSRENGPAIEHTDGSVWFYEKGKLHNENGPAIVDSKGNKWFYENDKLHNENGPAIEWVNGKTEYFLEGKNLPKEKWEQKIGK